MKVYEVKFDTECFQHLEVDDASMTADDLAFEATPRENWQQPMVCAVNLQLPEQDIWSVGVDSGGFAVNSKAGGELATFLEMAGELLPLTYKEELTLCNVLDCSDCADEDASEWQLDAAGNRLAMLRPFFFERCMPTPTLFKIPQLARKIYCCEIFEAPEEEFRACVLENGLTGLKFELIWEAEDPAWMKGTA